MTLLLGFQMSDFPQLMLQNAARMFIADLVNAGHKDAAAYLTSKYVNNTQHEGARINYLPPPRNVKEELLEG